MPTANVTEYLTIDTVIIGTPACVCQNLYVLHSTAHRGVDRILPGSAGVVAYPRRLHAIVHQLELVFFGDLDSDGVATASPQEGLRDNIAEVAAIAAPVTTGDGTRSVTWTRADGSTASADCHVGPLTVGGGSSAWARAMLELQVPSGQFV